MADELYHQCVAEFGLALERLAAGYEADLARRQDLLQEIHTALWRSLRTFDLRCSLRTWVYRVAHNTAVTHVRGALRQDWVALDEVQSLPFALDPDRTLLLDRLMTLIHQLRPLDRQVILLYLEDHDAREIAEITGFSAINVATKIHRIKNILTRKFHEGDTSHASERTPSGMAIPAVAAKPTSS